MAGTTPAKKNLNGLKVEAKLTVFDTPVEIKPMTDSEVGYRAPEGEKGISVTQTALVSAGLISKENAAKYLPAQTNIKTLIYNYKKSNVELAVQAIFKPGKLKKDYLDSLDATDRKYHGKLELFIAYLKEQLTLRGIDHSAVTGDDDAAKDALILLFAKQEDDGFILNKYPQIFTVDELFIYLGPKSDI